MQARFPALLIAPERPAATALSDVLRAVLDVAPDGTVVRFSLVDARGDTQLRRTLPASGRGTALSDCLALADTVAAIVERYLSRIAYESVENGQSALGDAVVATQDKPVGTAGPMAMTRSREILAVLGGGWRMAAGAEGKPDQNAFDGWLGVRLGLSPWLPRLEGIASLGISSGRDFVLPDARRAMLGRFPARLGCLLELAVGPGWVEPTLQAGVDLVTVSTRRVDTGTDLTVTFAPVVEAGVGYRVKIAGRLHVRPGVTFGLPLKRYDIRLQSTSATMPEIPVLMTPRAYALFGIETAWLFR
jgi:hypothetical protein